jgi:hypothetical protein
VATKLKTPNEETIGPAAEPAEPETELAKRLLESRHEATALPELALGE